jgi:hypothetical protein
MDNAQSNQLRDAIKDRSSELMEHVIAGRERKGRGDEFDVLCLFHEERTPSMHGHLGPGEGW